MNEENTKADDGGPAFPRPCSAIQDRVGDVFNHQEGMTLRTYLAAKAMVGILSNTEALQALVNTARDADEMVRIVAERSYRVSDAMIAASKK